MQKAQAEFTKWQAEYATEVLQIANKYPATTDALLRDMTRNIAARRESFKSVFGQYPK